MSSSSRSKRKRESDAMPEEIEVRCEKLTHTELDELGVDLETQPDGSLKIVSSPQEACQIDHWNRGNPNKRVGRGDAITCVNGVGTDQPDRMREIIDIDMELTLTVRRGDRNKTRTSNVMGASEHNVEQDPRLESKIRLSKLNEIDANHKVNHDRKPDLSADIRIRFPEAEYVGKYLTHGASKTVFIIRKSGHTQGRYDGNILKIRLRPRDGQWDKEPEIAQASKLAGYNIVPELYWEGIG